MVNLNTRPDRKSGMNRRGFLSHLQIAMLAVATMIIFSLFLYQYYVDMRERMMVQSCKASITAHDFVASKTSGDIFTDIKCPTQEITIKDNRNAKSIIAEDMRRCWYIWGEGEGRYFEGEGNFCHICSIYMFGDKKRTINGFMEYLHTEPMPVKYATDKGGLTYAKYLMGAKTASATEMTDRDFVDLSTIDKINTSQRYATIFIYASGKTAIAEVLEGGNKIKAGTAGAFGILGGGAAIGVGMFIASNPVGWVVGGVGLVAAGTTTIVATLTSNNPETLQQVVFRPYDAEELQNIKCVQIDVNQMSNAGTP